MEVLLIGAPDRSAASPSPGKLVRFLVDSGDHINAGEAYAEIEVSDVFNSFLLAI